MHMLESPVSYSLVQASNRTSPANRGAASHFAAQGFSLIEVVLALGVTSFAIISLMGMLPVGLNSIRESTGLTTQAQIARQIITEAQITPFDSLQNYSASFDNEGNPVANSNSAIYTADISLADLKVASNTGLATSVAKNMKVRLFSKSGRSDNYYTTLLYKND